MQKTTQLFRSPDAVPAGDGKSPKRKPATPKADGDFGTLADIAADAWINHPVLTLIWMTSAQFRALVTTYLKKVQARRDTGATRPGATQSLGQLVALMNEALPDVKVYIQKKYKKANAAAQYPCFGLVYRAGGWELPADRDNLKTSLESMKNAIAAEGFGTEEFGPPFWTDAQTRFTTFFDQAKTIDFKVSALVGGKNTGKALIRLVLRALRQIIEANYQKAAPANLREFGWQREDY